MGSEQSEVFLKYFSLMLQQWLKIKHNNLIQGSPKRKTQTGKNNTDSKNPPQRSKRAAAPSKPIKDESSGDDNESEDDEPLSKKAKAPPTVS